MKTEEKKEKCTACKGVGSLHYIGRKYRTPCPACEGTGLELLPTPPKVEVTEERNLLRRCYDEILDLRMKLRQRGCEGAASGVRRDRLESDLEKELGL